MKNFTMKKEPKEEGKKKKKKLLYLSFMISYIPWNKGLLLFEDEFKILRLFS
jgi:hypothetical protein